MTVALTMLKNGEGDAVVSAGSTGALVVGGTLIVKRIKGVKFEIAKMNGERMVRLDDEKKEQCMAQAREEL